MNSITSVSLLTSLKHLNLEGWNEAVRNYGDEMNEGKMKRAKRMRDERKKGEIKGGDIKMGEMRRSEIRWL